jgi:hypothetical protein
LPLNFAANELKKEKSHYYLDMSLTTVREKAVPSKEHRTNCRPPSMGHSDDLMPKNPPRTVEPAEPALEEFF